MKTYEVTFNLGKLTFEVVASDEEQAINHAMAEFGDAFAHGAFDKATSTREMLGEEQQHSRGGAERRDEETAGEKFFYLILSAANGGQIRHMVIDRNEFEGDDEIEGTLDLDSDEIYCGVRSTKENWEALEDAVKRLKMLRIQNSPPSTLPGTACPGGIP